MMKSSNIIIILFVIIITITSSNGDPRTADSIDGSLDAQPWYEMKRRRLPGGNTCDKNIDTTQCTSQGTKCKSNLYVKFDGLTYAASSGKFAGKIISNQCKFFEQSKDRATTDCCGETLGSFTGKFPTAGRVAWSILGQNIYGPFEAGFGKAGVTLENSQYTENTKVSNFYSPKT